MRELQEAFSSQQLTHDIFAADSQRGLIAAERGRWWQKILPLELSLMCVGDMSRYFSDFDVCNYKSMLA